MFRLEAPLFGKRAVFDWKGPEPLDDLLRRARADPKRLNRGVNKGVHRDVNRGVDSGVDRGVDMSVDSVWTRVWTWVCDQGRRSRCATGLVLRAGELWLSVQSSVAVCCEG